MVEFVKQHKIMCNEKGPLCHVDNKGIAPDKCSQAYIFFLFLH